MKKAKTEAKIVSSDVCSMSVYYDKDDVSNIRKIEIIPSQGREYINADDMLFGNETDFIGVRTK